MANELEYSSYPNYPNYPKSCEILIPITLKVPIIVQPEVIGKPPVCHNRNGHYPIQDEMSVTDDLTAEEEAVS